MCKLSLVQQLTVTSAQLLLLILNFTRSRSIHIMLLIQHTHTHLTALVLDYPLPGWAGTRKVKPIWILLKQETVSGSGISWTMCKSASRSRQITMPASHKSDFTVRIPFPPLNQHRQSTEGKLVLQHIELILWLVHTYTDCKTDLLIGPGDDLSFNDGMWCILSCQLCQNAQSVCFHQLPDQC